MMSRKRKASSPASTNRDYNSRRKQLRAACDFLSESESESESESKGDGSSELDDGEYLVKCILDEDDTRYLIDWEGPWSPTWEPKEYANEVALQVWEEKKRNRSARNSELAVGDSQIQLSSWNSESQESGRSSSQPVQHRIGEGRRHTTRRASPLFFSSEDSPEPQQPQIPSRSRTGSQDSSAEITDTRKLGVSDVGNGISSIPETTPSKSAPVFEYIPASPIPPEYRLPGEPDCVPAVSQASDGLGESVFSTQATSNLPCSSKSQTVDDHQGAGSVANGTRQHLQSDGREVPFRSKVDEVAETPSSNLNLVKISDSRADFAAGYSVSQTRSQSAEVDLHPSGDAFQVYQSGEPYDLVLTDSLPNRRASIGAMDGKSQEREVSSFASAMEKYGHIEGSTPREKMRNAYAQLRARQLNSVLPQAPSLSTMPPPAGDFGHLAPTTASATARTDKISTSHTSNFSQSEEHPTNTVSSEPPLNVRTDEEPIPHILHPSQSDLQPANTASLEPPAQLESQNSESPAVQTIQPSALAIDHTEKPSPGSVKLGPLEFAVPLPMDSRLKDVYNSVLEDNSGDMQEFLGCFRSNTTTSGYEHDRLASKMRVIVERLNNITTHPDIDLSGHTGDSEADLEKEASWAEYSSAKFLFLGYIVEIASNSDIHLVITVQGGKGSHVLERYLLGKGLIYTRPREEMGGRNNIEVSMTKGSLSFGIQTTQNTSILETFKRPLAIIALDSTFDIKSPSVEHIRTTFARHGNLLPVVRLLVSNSCEHIERCFSDVHDLQRLHLLIGHIVHLRNVVGDLQDDALGVHEDAEEVIPWLLSGDSSANWPLPAIEPIDIAELDNLNFTQDQHSSEPSSQEPLVATLSQQKRPTDMDDTTRTSKRPRVDSPQVPSLSTDNQTLNSDLQTLESNLVQMKNTHAVDINKLQKALADSQHRLRERDMSLGSLQHRYESQTKELHGIRRERDRLVEINVISEQRMGKQKDEITKLKDERTQLKRDLETARESLKVGGGSTAELEVAHEENRRLSAENASLRRKTEYEKNQSEYTREQYQTASTVAAQSGNEIRQLRQDNEALKRKVAGEASRLREINLNNDDTRHLSRISELEELVATRESLLNRKETKLREIRKNRPSTRATSLQPRSPKLTATSRTSSPGLVSRGSQLRHSSESGNNNSISGNH